jgi:ribonucleoside-diphosphate reductase alpha chain
MRIPAHRDLSRRRSGLTTAVTIGGEPFCLIANERADGSLGEVFIRHGKQGGTGAGLMDSYATALTVGIRRGVPLADLLRPGLGMSFVPSGHTDDPEIPCARSVVEYFSRRLAIDWLAEERGTRSHRGAEGGSER